MSEPHEDYYNVLGISRNATASQIKKAYRKQAVRWHPDKNNNSKESNEQFKKIAEAYDVLSDKQKKDVYDKFGIAGLKGGRPPQSSGSRSSDMPGGFSYTYKGDPNDLFSSFFKNSVRRQRSFGDGQPMPFGGGHDPFESMFGGFGGNTGFGGQNMRQQKRKAPEVIIKVPMSLEELNIGKHKKLKITRKSITLQRDDIKTIEIPTKKGWKAGTRITYTGDGDEVSPGVTQDLIFVISEKKHPLFTRQGNNLIHNIKLPLVDAITGCTIKVKTISGTFIDVVVPQLESSSHNKVVKGQGMPSPKHPGKVGDMILVFDIVFPKTKLTDMQKEAIKRALPR